MKTAQTANGQLVVASDMAPRQALCLACGNVVILRYQRGMNGEGNGYFWRHHRDHRECIATHASPYGFYREMVSGRTDHTLPGLWDMEESELGEERRPFGALGEANPWQLRFGFEK